MHIEIDKVLHQLGQVGRRDPADARLGLSLDRSEAREINGGPGGEVGADLTGARPRRRTEGAFHERLNVGFQNASLWPACRDLREVDAELPRQLAHRGAGVGGALISSPAVRRRWRTRRLGRRSGRWGRRLARGLFRYGGFGGSIRRRVGRVA